MTTPGLGATNTITVTNSASSIVSSGAAADSSGDIFNVGMLTANLLVTAPASTPPTATGQGMATILVATSGNSSTAPASGALACWTSTGYAQTCPASATTGIMRNCGGESDDVQPTKLRADCPDGNRSVPVRYVHGIGGGLRDRVGNQHATERNNASAKAYASTYDIWSIDVVSVTSWGSPAANITPWMFHDGTKMLFLGNTVAQFAIVDLCTSASGCQANFTAEIVQAQVSTDYTRSTLPMAIASYGSFSTMMDLGTLNCGQTLSPANSESACGLQYLSSDFGNCGHLDIDETTGYLTCGNLTNFKYIGTQTTVRWTMVVPLAPAFFNSPISALGPFRMSGGVEFRSQ